MPPTLLARKLISSATRLVFGFARHYERQETAEQEREPERHSMNADDHQQSVHSVRTDLTRPKSATAGESERELQWTCFHKMKRGITAASGWLYRLVRRQT